MSIICLAVSGLPVLNGGAIQSAQFTGEYDNQDEQVLTPLVNPTGMMGYLDTRLDHPTYYTA
jgi:hypothetical protein